MSVARTPHPVLTRYYRDDHERQRFVIALFDASAGFYDRVCQLMSFGSGRWYRRWTLTRLGLRPGMTVLDVASGTGLVARAAAEILGDSRAVTALDPSTGMLREARKQFGGPLVQGRVEDLPFRAAQFDLVTIGYALRHAHDLDAAFRECLHVLKPGGRLLVLEISRPASRARRALVRTYFTRVLPAIMAVIARNRSATMLTRYYWETIDHCVAPEAIMESLRQNGFVDVRRRVFGGVLSEYSGQRPRLDGASANGHVRGRDAAEAVAAENV